MVIKEAHGGRGQRLTSWGGSDEPGWSGAYALKSIGKESNVGRGRRGVWRDKNLPSGVWTREEDERSANQVGRRARPYERYDMRANCLVDNGGVCVLKAGVCALKVGVCVLKVGVCVLKVGVCWVYAGCMRGLVCAGWDVCGGLGVCVYAGCRRDLTCAFPGALSPQCNSAYTNNRKHLTSHSPLYLPLTTTSHGFLLFQLQAAAPLFHPLRATASPPNRRPRAQYSSP